MFVVPRDSSPLCRFRWKKNKWRWKEKFFGSQASVRREVADDDLWLVKLQRYKVAASDDLQNSAMITAQQIINNRKWFRKWKQIFHPPAFIVSENTKIISSSLISCRAKNSQKRKYLNEIFTSRAASRGEKRRCQDSTWFRNLCFWSFMIYAARVVNDIFRLLPLWDVLVRNIARGGKTLTVDECRTSHQSWNSFRSSNIMIRLTTFIMWFWTTWENVERNIKQFSLSSQFQWQPWQPQKFVYTSSQWF